jgi:hypothetical protein
MSKLERLVQSGVLDDAQLTDDQRQMIENEISEQELETLVRVGNKLRLAPTLAQKKVGCAL